MAAPLRAPDLVGKRVRVRLAGALCDGVVSFYGETHWHATLLGVAGYRGRWRFGREGTPR